MDEKMIGKEAFVKAILTLFDEGFEGPKGAGTWYIDNDPGAGLLATVGALDASAASRPLSPGDPLSTASHVDHVRFSLNLANRAARGENPYPSANWHDSWKLRTVDEAAWKAIQDALKKEVADLRAVLASGKAIEEEEYATGFLGLLCHTAWHLGAIRQGLGLVKAPSEG
jgi:hypothetical protein